MGQSIVKADIEQIRNAISDWIVAYRFVPTQESKACAPTQIKARTLFYKARWDLSPQDSDVAVSMRVSIRVYLNIFIHLLMIGGLTYCVYLLEPIMHEFAHKAVLAFILTAISIIILISIVNYRIEIKLGRLEKDFWNCVSKNHDLIQTSRYEPSLTHGRQLIFKQILILAFIITICTKVFGRIGFLGSLLLFTMSLTLIMVGHVRRKDSQWHWRLWIIENMYSWFNVLIGLMGILFIFAFIEILIPLKGAASSPAEVIRNWQLREISPAHSHIIEPDTLAIIHDIVRLKMQDYSIAGNIEYENTFNKMLLFFCGGLLILMVISIFFFSYLILKSKLKISRLWQNISEKPDSVPNVPYFEQSLNWKVPASFYVVMLVFCLTATVVNIVAAVLTIDAMGYIFIGRAVFIAQSANIYSWLFVSCKVLFGDNLGFVIASSLLIVLFLPMLLVFASFLRRLIIRLFFYQRLLSSIKTPFDRKTLMLQNFANNTSQRCSIKAPLLLIDNSYQLIHTCLLINLRPVIVINRRLFDILDTDELKAVVAHELGHIKTGLLKSQILKALSIILLFPNYFLSICLNWPKYEIESDKFALEQTGNPDALKRAIVKISVAQLDYAGKNKQRTIFDKLKYRSADTIRSMSFFFGDSLLGYTHPHQSNRLAAIDSYKKEVKQ